MPPPYVAVVPRIQNETFPTLTPSQYNELAVEIVAPQKAPSPPRQGDVPARTARMRLYESLNIRKIRAVAYDAQSGVMGKREFEHFIQMPQGKSLSWDERANIQRNQARSYGSFFTVVPHTSEDARIQLLMGV